MTEYFAKRAAREAEMARVVRRDLLAVASPPSISMNTIPHKTWTQDEFFAWAEKQDRRYEFDGMQPVAMAGGTVNTGIVQRNLQGTLFNKLRGGKCQPFGPDNGVATVGKTIRYPD